MKIKNHWFGTPRSIMIGAVTDPEPATNRIDYRNIMEIGDLVDYRKPGSAQKQLATIIWFETDSRGWPETVTIRLQDGREIETSVNNISY